MIKQAFVAFVVALFLLDRSTNATTMDNENLINLQLFAGLNISAVERCRTNIVQQTLSVDCLINNTFKDSDEVNFFLLSMFETLNSTNDRRTLGINQLREYVKALLNGNSNNGESNSSDTNSTSSQGPQRFIDFAQCGVYPACVVNSVPGNINLWSFTCDQPIVVFIAIVGILLSVIVIISNVLIIVVTLRTKSLRKPHGYFKISLALADLISGIFVVPSIAHNTLTTIDYDKQIYTTLEVAKFASFDETPSAEANFFGVMGIISSITAVLSLLVLSIDSFLAVKWPMQYRIGDIVTTKKAILVVAVIWIASLLLGFLPLLAENTIVYGLSYGTFQYIPIFREIAGTKVGDHALKRFPHVFAYVIIVWGLPFVITWILTVWTSIQSRKMLKNMKEARRRSVRSEKALNKVDRDLVRTVAVVLTLFTFTILPVFVVGVFIVIAPTGECSNQALIIAFFFSTYILICGRFLNVIIYNVFNKEFRTAFNSFTSSITAACCPSAIYSGLPKKSRRGKSASSRALSTDKSHSKETEVTTRVTNGSISLSTSTEKSTLPSPSTANVPYKYSVSGESEVHGPLYSNSVFTIDEADEK